MRRNKTKKPTPDVVFKRSNKPLDLTYRLARQSDLPLMEWMGEYTHFRKVFQHTFREQQAGRRLMVVADFNNFPIGQVFILIKNSTSFGVRQRHGYLYSLRVMQPFQKMGIGTTLIRLAEDIMRSKKLETASIAVAKDNRNALGLYQKLGYQIYAEDEGEWSYTNHENRIVHVHEPCWMLDKNL